MNYLITVDYEKCTGCRICELACSFSLAKEFNPARSRIKIIRSEEEGIVYTIPVLCQQCENAPCMQLCPISQALYRDPKSGTVMVNEDRCIGCRKCVYVCPFGAISVDPDKGFAVKCMHCDGEPKCVELCPKEALCYVRSDKIGIKEGRGGVEKFLEYQRGLASSSEK